MTTEKFTAEVGKVLNLMIHSLYTNKEIFVRELISNASDACDKLRYLAISNPELLEDDSELQIAVRIDKDAKEIHISDNGIGMDKQDLIDNLGTIARSGTARFLDQMSGDNKKDASLIGQFGVGFYSAYMIAEKVTVMSRKAGEKQAYKWTSDGVEEYTIEDCDKQSRGTEIILKIRDSEEEYLDQFRVKHLIKTYSDHIFIPIYFEQNDSKLQVNSSSALWRKNKSEITQEQYNECYKSLSYAADEPWMILHNKSEGMIEFTNLLFVPSTKTFDLFHPDRKRRVKLYIKRVFITDENIDLIPRYMRFLRGVVDCDSLPLNISRQTLQHNQVVNKIQRIIVSRFIEELAKRKKEDAEGFEVFWKNFGSVLKEGLCEPGAENSEKLLDVCIFYSSKLGRMISLQDYVDNMVSGQEEIYYLSGDNLEQMRNSPQLEGFKKKDIDVLLFTDPVDDFWVSVLHKYKEHDIKSINRSNIDLSKFEGENKSDDSDSDKKSEPLLNYFKEVLKDLVQDVKISKKLESVPACLSVADGNLDIRMERFLVEQKQLQGTSAKVLEINPNHSLITKVSELLDKEEKSSVEDLVMLVYDQACILENEPVADPGAFCRRFNKFIQYNA